MAVGEQEDVSAAGRPVDHPFGARGNRVDGFTQRDAAGPDGPARVLALDLG